MKSGYEWFPFSRYSDNIWSLEHIHAQQSLNITDNNERRLLLSEQKKLTIQLFYLEDITLVDK
jgi:hypothetical protein